MVLMKNLLKVSNYTLKINPVESYVYRRLFSKKSKNSSYFQEEWWNKNTWNSYSRRLSGTEYCETIF